MSISDTRDAKRYASIAEVAAAQCALYTEEARKAPDYTNAAKEYAEIAKTSAETAADSAQESLNSANGASSSAVDAQESANDAFQSAQEAAAAVGGTLRVPEASISVLPSVINRRAFYPHFDASGDADVISPYDMGLWVNNPVIGSFEEGATLTSSTDVLIYLTTGLYYRWDGDFDKVVPAGSTPESTGGVGVGAWVNVTDLTLRSALAEPTGAALIGGLGQITTSAYGFTGIGNESTLASAFLQYCVDNKLIAVIDIDVNWDGLVFSDSPLFISGGGGTISGFCIIRGDLLKTRTNSVIVGTAGDYTTYAAGVTTISGDFSAYSAGDQVVVELNDDSTFDGAQNQIGMHFTTAASASSSQLVLTDGLRFPFDRLKVSKTEFLKYPNSIGKGNYSIPGNFSFLSDGQVVRFENITGVDSVDGTTRYFEYSIVKSATAERLILVDPLEYDHGNPVIVGADFISDITLRNVSLGVLQLRAIRRITVNGIKGQRSINDYLYEGVYTAGIFDGSTPNIINFTYAKRLNVSNIVSSGATGVTDNASFKMMSPVMCNLDNVIASDYGISSGSQSENGFYVDYAFTPYQNKGIDCNFKNIVTGKEKGGLGVWIDGMWGGSGKGMHAGGHGRLYECVDFIADLSCSKGLFLRNCIRSNIQTRAKFAQIAGCQYTMLHSSILTGGASDNSNRVISIVGSGSGPWTTPIGNDIIIKDCRNTSTTSTDTTLYFGNITNMIVDGLKDIAGLTASIANSGSNISGEISIRNHDLKNTISIGSYTSPHRFESDVAIGSSTAAAWDRRRLILGDIYMWKSGSALKVLQGSAPTADTDGFYLTQKVAVPSTATSGGSLGQWAADTSYMYVCVATNTWRRVAVASW